jgi:hypothetical protein
VALALAVLGGACSDDDDSNVNPTPVPTPTPAPAPTPTPTPTPEPVEGPQPGEEVSFLGKVRSIEGEVVRVNEDDVVVNANTFLVDELGNPIAMGDIVVGSVVRVRGVYNVDATAIDAKRITLLE